MRKGLFITFEGTEGSGKSTQSKLLYQFLKKKGLKALHLRDPGGTGLGERIRKILLNPDKKLAAIIETLLFMVCRSQLAGEKILPALREKKIVVCDRFADATVCYQGYGSGVNLKLIGALNRVATGGIQPDLTFFLDLGVKKGLRRSLKAKGFADRIEQKPHNFHRRVRGGYLTLIKKYPRRIKRISVEKQTRNQTQRIVRRVVLDAIKRYQRPR